jgi:iron complex transport system permease protein
LIFLLFLVLAASIRYGAIDFSIADICRAFLSLLPGHPDPTLDQRIFLELRLPRAVLCALVGASLGVGGTLMQALFRNPIVEPGLVGTSSGAAFGSALYFVLGGVLNIGASLWSLPIAACIGGVLSTYLVFLLARSRDDGRASIVMLLLTGLAVNALFMSAIGFLS